MQTYEEIAAEFHAHGLALRGGLRADDGHDLPPVDDVPTRTLLLVGNLGRDMWPHFAKARETTPELALDEWTREVCEPIAANFKARAIYVFDGPPFHPFQQWARAAEGLQQAPNSMLIHPEYGIWQAYRAALLLPHAIELPEIPEFDHPCDHCAGKPCIQDCPADAVQADGFEFGNCVEHFRRTPITSCNDGCLARMACPVGSEHAYPVEQRHFHMQHFVARHVTGGNA